MLKTITLYLQTFLLYLKLKMGSKISKLHMWQLDLTIFSLKNRITIVDKNSFGFIARVTVNNAKRFFLIRHWPKSDFIVFRTVICPEKQYEKIVDYFNSVNSHYRILDGGANVGYTTIYFKTLFPNSTIISVEPEKNNFSFLQQNITLNSLNMIHCVNAGLWYENASLMIDNSFRDKGDHSFSVHKAQLESKLKGLKITDLIRSYGWEAIDILKLDIEGAEAEIFKNDQDFIDFLPKINLLIIEIHDEFDARKHILDLLSINNFSLLNQGELIFAFNNKFG